MLEESDEEREKEQDRSDHNDKSENCDSSNSKSCDDSHGKCISVLNISGFFFQLRNEFNFWNEYFGSRAK